MLSFEKLVVLQYLSSYLTSSAFERSLEELFSNAIISVFFLLQLMGHAVKEGNRTLELRRANAFLLKFAYFVQKH